MRLRVPTELWAASLLATLGIAPVACGGRALRHDDGEAATGGASSNAGTSSSAGVPSTGGTSSTGGSESAGGEPSIGGSTAGQAGTTGGTGAVANNPFPCESPTPIVDETSGFVRCANGFITRSFIAECPSLAPRPNSIPNYDPATDTCQYDSDCTEYPHGFCGKILRNGQIGSMNSYRSCQYGCVSDTECDPGLICVCDDPVGLCKQASCNSDADCAPGLHCASYDPTACGRVAFACQTEQDACMTETDCNREICWLNESGQRACGGQPCAEGRPFLVHGVARTAGVATRLDWALDPLRPDLDGLDTALRERLAQKWLRAARLEHASIAAFGRFLLELLAFGAPAELVALTIQALDDERRHAELCFSLASEFAGLPLGPAELDLEGALPAPTLERSLVTTIREGCIGETVAALEAAELAERVSDPVLRSALTRIAADEQRHAELAFRFVDWALSSTGEHARALVACELERVRRELASLSLIDDPASSELARRGILSDGLSRAVRQAALEAAVLPGLEGLLEPARTRSAA